MGDIFSCQEVPFQPGRHPRSAGTHPVRLRVRFFLSFQRGWSLEAACWDSKSCASTPQYIALIHAGFGPCLLVVGTATEMTGQLTCQGRATQVQRGSSQYRLHHLSQGLISEHLAHRRPSAIDILVRIFLL